MSMADALKAQVFQRVLSLPPQWVRRLAGRPIRMDGMTLSAQSQLMLRLQRLSFERGAETLPIPQGRVAMRRHAFIAGGTQPIGETRDVTVNGAEGPLDARLYVPTSKTEGPLLVFFHGGGMIYGDLDSHDALCRFLAEHADVRVLAVDYRLAPEHPFPAGVDDAFAAYQDVLKNATDYGADPERLAVGGDSAGGYLAAATAIRAAEHNLPLRYQLLIYPVTKMSGGTRSRELFARDLYLTHDFMELATASYLGGEDLEHPRASVLHAEIPDGLAPAYVATAGFDPLRDEGEAYAAELEEAGVPVRAKRYGGEIHGFANIVGVEGMPRRAVLEMAEALRTALS